MNLCDFRLPAMALIFTLQLSLGRAKTISINIKTVDARTSRPLAGVSTRWMEERQDLILGTHRFGPTNLPPSAQDGVISRRKVRTIDFFTDRLHGNQYCLGMAAQLAATESKT
jgi:hypothetical protein